MKDILVIGATGKQGNAVVKQLLEDGWYVSALTRNKNNRKLSDIGHPHLSIVEGDLSDNVSLQSAMKGKYGLYSIQPIVKDDVSEELRQGMKIIEIAEQENIQHIVYSTAGGVNRNRTGPHFEVLAKIENRLMESNINATVIKPSFFMDNFLRIAKVERMSDKIILIENGEIILNDSTSHIRTNQQSQITLSDEYIRKLKLDKDDLVIQKNHNGTIKIITSNVNDTILYLQQLHINLDDIEIQ
ncbi:NmrA family NAD(P)-binding protein, partial [Staphylococcus aureus]|nr:NmrA family NAD(P)-binding protein [Staphylococcus aureus]